MKLWTEGRRQLASGMRQLAGTRTRYRRAYDAPLAGLISGRVELGNPQPHPPAENLCGVGFTNATS